MKFNTAIAALMELLNGISAHGSLTREELTTYIKLLCPIAPHLCEEIWEKIGGEGFLSMSSWPVYEESKTVDATVKVGVQVNGKLRGVVELPADCQKEEAMKLVSQDPKIQAFLEGKNLVKEIYVPNKIVNLVVK